MQSQLLIAKPISSQDDEYMNIGVNFPIRYPFNLFLNIKQLIDINATLIYFFIYSIGENKIVLWGAYDKHTHDFMIDGSCRYRTNELYNMSKLWKSRDFVYTANTIENRPNKLINLYTGESQLDYSEYLRYKFFLAYFNGLITEEELETKYPGTIYVIYNKIYLDHDILPQDAEFTEYLQEYIDHIDVTVKNYEKNLNRTDLDYQLLNKLTSTLQQSVLDITTRFYDNLKNGRFLSDSYYKSLKECPTIDVCNKAYDSQCGVYYYGDTDLGYTNDRDKNFLL